MKIFSVWFELLGRLAPFVMTGEPEDGRSCGVPSHGASCQGRGLCRPVLIALGTGAIIYDGLSQTEPYFNLFIAQTPLGTGEVRDP